MRDLSELMATILATNIKSLRLREGPNQTEFAERLGVSQGTVARWEAGSKPQYEYIVAMAAMAGVSVQDFTGHLLAGDPPKFDGLSPVVFLPVQLPSEDALTEMFAGLLETIPPNTDSGVIAQKLAQLLPNALARTVSHSRVEGAQQDHSLLPRGGREGAPKSGRTHQR